jgi:NADH dehydrogenase [ubiquinone] 1 alpha subcomplex assembly factor 7
VTGGKPSAPTPLARRLLARIAAHGPMSVADYVAACLNDAEHGYYRHRPAVGAAGDFITAPEISQVFGEIIGLWCAVVWQQLGSPASVRLVELGPGRGTLMRDALRAIRIVPAFQAALRVELVETNEALKPLQRATLAGAGVPLLWSDTLQAGSGNVILIANEFLDTLPLQQWVYRGGAWREHCVGVDAGGDLAFVDSEGAAPPLPAGMTPPRDGDVFESRTAEFARLCARLAALGSPCAALFIDYGHTAPDYGDTLQAVAAHAYSDPLRTPGESDLTAQVDFSAFAAAARAHGFAVDGPVPQARFLGRLGIIERASRLMAANPAKASEIEAAVARLMAPGGMGSRFHAIGLRSGDAAPLPALSTVDMRRTAP